MLCWGLNYVVRTVVARNTKYTRIVYEFFYAFNIARGKRLSLKVGYFLVLCENIVVYSVFSLND